jgi:vacuolar protein sorting-associated protein 13A/C
MKIPGMCTVPINRDIPPFHSPAVPILLTSSPLPSSLSLSPSTLGVGYLWSGETLYWKDAVYGARGMTSPGLSRRSRQTQQKGFPVSVTCQAEEDPSIGDRRDVHTPPFRFRVGAIFDERTMIASKYPDMYIDIYPPLEIENLLPYDIRCRIVDRTTRQEYSNHMLKGSSSPLHILQTGHLLLMAIEMTDTGKARWGGGP